jgi:non-heme chloroperoxidase
MLDYVHAYGEDQIACTSWVEAVSRLGEPLLQAEFIGADFLAIALGFFSEHVEDSVTALQRLIRLCVHEEPSPEEAYFFLGYNVSVPPYIRQRLFSRHLNHDSVIAQMHKPMWLSYGEQDVIVRLSMGQHIADLAKHAILSVYPQVGHAPFWEVLERFNRESRAFRESV